MMSSRISKKRIISTKIQNLEKKLQNKGKEEEALRSSIKKEASQESRRTLQQKAIKEVEKNVMSIYPEY